MNNSNNDLGKGMDISPSKAKKTTRKKLSAFEKLKNCCIPSCFKNEKEYTCDLVMYSLTCNKLSHCLYDFDCPSFDKTYKNEKYQF